MMRTKFFLMVLAAIVMGSQVTLFAQEKKGAKSERRQFNKEQMLEIQCNQIIKGLALDDVTATKFIPVLQSATGIPATVLHAATAPAILTILLPILTAPLPYSTTSYMVP